MRGVTALWLLLQVVPALADEPVLADQTDDVALLEFLGSFDAEDDAWLDSLLLDDNAAQDKVPERTEPEENQ